MAGVLARTVFRTVSRTPQLFAAPLAIRARNYADWMMPDPREHATGLERKELDLIAAGNPDPFNMQPMKKGAGTRASPTKVPSIGPERLIGCLCHEDQFYVSWFWLYKGEAKRCQCGHWYKLYEVPDVYN